MDDFLCKSDLSLALKSSRGSWRSSAAMCSSGNSSGSAVLTVTTRRSQKLGYRIVELVYQLACGLRWAESA